VTSAGDAGGGVEIMAPRDGGGPRSSASAIISPGSACRRRTGELGRVRLDLVTAVTTSDDQPQLGLRRMPSAIGGLGSDFIVTARRQHTSPRVGVARRGRPARHREWRSPPRRGGFSDRMPTNRPVVWQLVLGQSRGGLALSRQNRILTIDRGTVYRAPSQAGSGNDINAGSPGSQKAPT
jgi:hypothetical protein